MFYLLFYISNNLKKIISNVLCDFNTKFSFPKCEGGTCRQKVIYTSIFPYYLDLI